MELTTLSIRVNQTDKNNFKVFCDEVGLDMTSAINMFIKTVLKEGRIPFEISNFSNSQYTIEKVDDDLGKIVFE